MKTEKNIEDNVSKALFEAIEVGKHIKYIRRMMKISQAELATELGMSLRAYQRVENCESQLKLSQIIRIMNRVDPCFIRYLDHYFENKKFRHYSFLCLEDSSMPRELSSSYLFPTIKDQEFIKSVLIDCDLEKISNVGYWEWHIQERKFFFCSTMQEIFCLRNKGSSKIFYFLTLLQKKVKGERSYVVLNKIRCPFYAVIHDTYCSVQVVTKEGKQILIGSCVDLKYLK